MKTRLLLPILAALAPAAFAAQPGPDFHQHLGLQMWSLRATSKTDTPKALDLVRQFGVTEIETAGLGTLTLDQYAADLKSRGLVAIGIHADYGLLQKNVDDVIHTAKTLGAHYIVMPWIPHTAPLTIEQAHQVAADFNRWGAAIHAAGLQFGWHPHGFEFTVSPSGETPCDVIVRETKPENLVLEMDVFWVLHAGQDPVTLLKKYGSRWELMHVKDMRKGATERNETGSAPPTDNVAVGDGQIDWRAVLSTAQEVGVQHYLLEDETPTPLKCIPESLQYLRALKL